MLFDERIIQDLKDTYQTLERNDKIFSQEDLTCYFTTFRARFGPDKLLSLGDEALLESVYSFDKDSLFYWLEFKNDEEFPSINFGSIADGSAFKYGLFRKKETGVWTTGTPQHPVSLTKEQAIELARKHRAQLIKGAELLEQLPEQATEADYDTLQREMERVAPVVSKLSWGHKYFHLLYPDKLDDFHNPDYQRFHLIKLLQLPPEGKGRYVLAAYFVALARQFALPMSNLMATLNARDGREPYSYWRLIIENNQTNGGWASMRDGQYITINRLQIGDLSVIANSKSGKSELQVMLFPPERPQVQQASLPSAIDTIPASVGNMTVTEVFDFKWHIAINDRVLVCEGSTVLGVGKVIGPYMYVASSVAPHRIPVEWLTLERWQLPDSEGTQRAIYRMKQEKNFLEAERYISRNASPAGSSPENTQDNQASEFVQPLPPLPSEADRIRAILDRKGQVILYGPPGTGKTYWAEYTARELAARTSFGKVFDQLMDEQKARILGTDAQSNGTVRLCTFHPAYGYEDFLEGFRPEAVNGQMHFILRDGIFKKLCQDAERHPNERFYLIIDEINRGDIPRIFGELLTVLEKDKRGKTIMLPLTGKPFRVPANVFVIGTMNMADRSIALLDAALRRRFGFMELMPDSNVLGDAVIGGIPLGLWLTALNERICQYVGRDARNLQVGHSYLLEHGRPIGDFATFAKILQEDIVPLLEEYCYEDYTTLEQILGTGLVDIQQRRIREELFALANQDRLVQALLALSPDITASALALISEAQAIEDQAEESERDEENGNTQV